MSDLKYLYYSIKQRQLLVLYLEDGEFDLYYVRFPFEFESKTFFDSTRLILFCESYNKTTANKYRELYGIKPPYVLHTYIGIGGEVVCSFTFHGHRLSVADGLNFPKLSTAVWSQEVDAPLDNFCKQHQNEMFNLSAVIAFHKFFIDRMVIAPIGPSFFNAKLDGIIYHTEIRADSDFWFLHFPNSLSNDHIFEYYNIPKDEVLKVINQEHWRGGWPETPESLVYVLIDYINENRMAIPVDYKFEIDGNKIITYFDEFEIKQTKTGKWYIRGNIESICLLFKVPDNTALKRFVNKILGYKIRHGVFPECDSREEVTKLLKTIRDDR